MDTSGDHSVFANLAQPVGELCSVAALDPGRARTLRDEGRAMPLADAVAAALS